MAFVSMIIVFLGIVAVIMLLSLIVGGILLAVGKAEKKKAIREGRNYSKAPIIVGYIFISIPFVLVLGVLVFVAISNAYTSIKRLSYENCIDKWRNEWVSSNEVREDIVEEFFKAADNKDKDALMELYSEEIRDDCEIEKQVEDFLIEYPEGFSELEFDYKGGHEEGSSNYGVSSEYLNASYEVEKDGEYYYISFGVCYENDEEPDKIGLDYMIVNSEKAKVLKDESDYEHGYNEHIISDINVIEDFETRRIAGIPYRYVEKDIIYTREEVLDVIRESNDLYKLYSYLGEPNGVGGRLNKVIYEIESENGEPRYIEITHTGDGEIVKDLTCIVGTEEDMIVRFNENLEVESTEN